MCWFFCSAFFETELFKYYLKNQSIMQFNSLEKLSIIELTDLFNRSFADYFVKIEITPEQ